jgi:hypothetical protein
MNPEQLQARVRRLNGILWPEDWNSDLRFLLTGAVIGASFAAVFIMLLLVIDAVLRVVL